MKWNEFDTNIREYFKNLRDSENLFDVTLVTEDEKQIKAHRLILAAGSQFFSDIFLKNDDANMLIYLKGIRITQLENIVDFIYNGEASIMQEDLKEFLANGKELKLKGFQEELHDKKGKILRSQHQMMK